MKSFAKSLTTLALASVAIAGSINFSANAYVVDFTYVTPTDGSGKTSVVAGASNASTANVFVETFDAKNGGTTNSFGCGLDNPGVTFSGGTWDMRKGTLGGVAAAPAGDSTCFAFGPSQGSPTPDTVNLNYSALLTSGTSYLNYFGLYYGSIDNYNDISFFNSTGGLISTVTGSSLISQFGGSSGNQTSDSSNIYVNLYFAPSEGFTSFSFTTRSVAFEMDNLVVGRDIQQNVPEPASLALVGLGLLGLVATRRPKAAK